MRNNHGRKERAPFQFCLPTTEPEFPLIVFHLHKPPVVTWGAVKGAPGQGAFILTLDSSPRHLQSSWERSATQFSWASFLSGEVSVRIGTPSAMLPNRLVSSITDFVNYCPCFKSSATRSLYAAPL